MFFVGGIQIGADRPRSPNEFQQTITALARYLEGATSVLIHRPDHQTQACQTSDVWPEPD